MRQQFRILICAVTASIFLLTCGGKETVASKSARALREAQARGEPVGGAHAGHDASAGEATASAMDHSTMTDMDHSKVGMPGGSTAMAGMDHNKMPGMQPGQRLMVGMDHSGMQHGGTPSGQQSMAGMDHSNMPGMQPRGARRGESMAGMDHSNMPGMQQAGTQRGQQSMSGMDHSNMPGMQPGGTQRGEQSMAAMDHSGMQHGGTPAGQQPAAGMDHSNMPGMQHTAAQSQPVASAPTTSSEMARLQPSATLAPDRLDTPSAVSVSEANKSAQNIPDGDIRHIVPGQDTENPPTPQSAVWSSTSQTSAPAHGARSVAQPSVAQPAATLYACPMHPEVTSTKPATCPKCGMALVKKN
jgi:uncharacterized protein involved in copper resistance